MRSSLSRKSPRAQLLACREQQPRPQRPVAESCQQRRLCLLLLWQRHLQLQGVVVKHPLCLLAASLPATAAVTMAAY